MNKFSTLFLLCAIAFSAKSQTPPVPEPQAFGKIDKSDLEMTSCDFEKDANAMVLFNKGDQYYDAVFGLVEDVHKRIKIFNDHGKDAANVRIPYYGGDYRETISDIQAETINLVDGKIEITKLDKKLIYVQHIDKIRNELVFTMPNIKPGSVLEYKYRWYSPLFYNFPNWFFQEKIPVRYSEYDTEIPEMLYFKAQTHTRVPYYKHSTSTGTGTLGTGDESLPYNKERELRVMANVPSLPDEPYMNSDADNLECVLFQLTTVRPLRGFAPSFDDTWAKIGGTLLDDEDFGSQLRRKLDNEEAIIGKAAALKTDDEKIAYVFNEVKNTMKWNGIDRWYTNDGTSKAWENKTGNSTEINLILYHLLNKSGIKAYPMVVSTRNHGKVNPYTPSIAQFNRAVVYIPVDSTKNYVLDASGKYNTYNEPPANLLNSSGLYIDKADKTYDIAFLQRKDPIRQVVMINAEIKPDGKLSGTAQINSFSYHRVNDIRKYKTDGEKKYTDSLCDGDNSLKISSIKFQNMEVDTLPLTQNVDFNLELTGSDENYIYFKPNIFTAMHTNPFINENRYTDIDFSYRNNYAVNGVYKVPAGYKVDAMPKSTSMTMPDNSITFRRLVATQDGMIVVRYMLDFKKSIYFKENYPEFHEFFKKMNEMMNEQVVLKKG